MKSTDLSSQFHILSKYKETREKAQNAYQSSFDFKFFFFFSSSNLLLMPQAQTCV